MLCTTATVQKIVTEILASPDSESSIAFGKDARDLLIDCCVEFITLISSEANEISEKESKKTIAPEHIDKALRELGFPEYVREVLASAGDMKESLKVSKQPYLVLEPGEGLTDLRNNADEWCCRHERRRQARWIRVASARKSCCNNSRSCLLRLIANSTRLEATTEYELRPGWHCGLRMAAFWIL